MVNLEREKGIRAALRTLPGLGSQRLRQLIAVFGSAQAAWEAPAEAFKDWGAVWVGEMLRLRNSIQPEHIEAELNREGIQTVIPDEGIYPKLLVELADAPPILYYQGHLAEGQEALAIVGSRHGTPYGKAAAEFLARKVAERGIAIVSGLARGIDTSAHKGALAAGGVTWAFLGNGLDRVYPPENRKLAEAILERGALLSEFIPGTPPDGKHFPARNRLISGSSRGVVVIEAARKSGALITVDFALEQGREVFALPGPIFSEMSKGTNHLLRQGARIVDEVEDIWAEIPCWQAEEQGFPPAFRAAPGSALAPETMNKDPGQAEVMEQMSDLPLHINQIACRVTLPVSRIPLILLELQLAGLIEQLPGQNYVLARKI